MEKHPCFWFLDETGILLPPPEQGGQFALGAIIYASPDDLIEELHEIFECLCGLLKKDRTAVEFKFNTITKTTLPIYKRFVQRMENDGFWRFCSVVLNLDDPKFVRPKDALESWQCYLRWTKQLISKNLKANETATVIADFYKRPKAKVNSFGTLPRVVPGLHDTLQVESQGVLLVQMADLFLGASLYKGVDRKSVV